jgi:hypothetical protein
MKFSIASFLLLVLAIVSCVSASPAVARNAIEIVDEPTLLTNTHQLAERNLKYPIKCNDALVAKIMANVKADLYAKVFGSITGTVSNRIVLSA